MDLLSLKAIFGVQDKNFMFNPSGESQIHLKIRNFIV
jgi:hypothetical protein